MIKSKTQYPYHLIVIDNNSTDLSRAYLSNIKLKDSIRSKMTLISNQYNLGVSKAWNQGIALCNGDYVVFLNPDIKLTSNWLEKMVACAKRHPKAAVVGAKILNYDGTIRHAQGNYRNEKDGPGKFSKEAKVQVVQGSCFLVKRSIFQIIGTFDERFFVYAEEGDFCLRVRRAGYDVMYAPVPIYHFREGSSLPQAERMRLRMKSSQLFQAKWGNLR
jgi:GT2 family glycosyltransferase